MERIDADVIRRNEYNRPYHSCPVLDKSTSDLQTDKGEGINIGFANVDATCHMAKKHKTTIILLSNLPNFMGTPLFFCERNSTKL